MSQILRAKKKDIEKLLAFMEDKASDDYMYNNLRQMVLLPDDYADKKNEEETTVYIGMDVVGSSGNIIWLHEGDFFEDASKIVPTLSSEGYHENVDSNIIFGYSSDANGKTDGQQSQLISCPSYRTRKRGGENT